MNEQDYNDMLAELTAELSDTETEVDTAKLSSKLNNAIREVKLAVNYPRHYTAEDIAEDLKQYYGNIHDLTLYDYNQSGAEGEIQHNENGTNRTWKARRDCFNGIYSFAKSVI